MLFSFLIWADPDRHLHASGEQFEQLPVAFVDVGAQFAELALEVGALAGDLGHHDPGEEIAEFLGGELLPGRRSGPPPGLQWVSTITPS